MSRPGSNWELPGVVACLICALPAFAQAPATVTLHSGTEVPLVTDAPLSSKTSVKGDLVQLTVAEDVRVDGQVVIAKGSPATGQIVEARAKGALGMSGRLIVRPLYLRLGTDTVRLSGQAADKGSVTPGAVIGMALLTPGFTGRSAAIPAGTRIMAIVERTLGLFVAKP